MNRFDDIFPEKVKEAFYSYNAGHLADEGWKLFVKNRRKKRGIILLIPFWARAASVLILLSAGSAFLYWTFYQQKGTGTVVVHTDSTEMKEARQETARETAAGGLKEPGQHAPVPKSAKPVTAVLAHVEKVPEATAGIRPEEKTTRQPDTDRYADRFIPEPVDRKFVVLSVKEKKKPAVLVPLKAEEGNRSLPEVDVSSYQKTSLMAGLSGMMAGVEDRIASTPGVSMGFYLEHRLNRSVAIRPGLALARHDYSLSDRYVGDRLLESSHDMSNMAGTIDSYDSHLEMLTMEVPVNLVFTLLERGEKRFFVSAGASTVFYLDQRFSGNYLSVTTRENLNTYTGEITYETSYNTVYAESDHPAFSHVDLFGLTNLSAGYAFPVGKTSRMLLEPWVQLPVTDITSLHLRMRYGGLSLKVQFGK
ncbi:MAG: outer membrane beta-barrel protein [Bacteroidales bacterium]